jgi:hypothetical protein
MSASSFPLGRLLAHTWQQWSQRWPLSTFEKVIAANSVIILLETGPAGGSLNRTQRRITS